MPGQLSLFKSRRQRGVAPKPPTEFNIHVQVADILRHWSAPGWRWTHFPAGEHRNVRTAAKLKRMGTMPGWPDFILLPPRANDNDEYGSRPHVARLGGAHFLELKRKGGRLSDAQLQFANWCELHGYPYMKANNFQDAVVILRHWGAVLSKVHP